jgi:hypothetical protein
MKFIGGGGKEVWMKEQVGLFICLMPPLGQHLVSIAGQQAEIEQTPRRDTVSDGYRLRPTQGVLCSVGGKRISGSGDPIGVHIDRNGRCKHAGHS